MINSKEIQTSLIEITNFNATINFNDAIFADNHVYNIINIHDVSGIALFQNITFYDNVIYSHILSFKNIYILVINSILSNQTNKDCQNNGGFLRSENVFFRKIQNLTISDSCSSQTTIGLKFIDIDIDQLMAKFHDNDQPSVPNSEKNQFYLIYI